MRAQLDVGGLGVLDVGGRLVLDSPPGEGTRVRFPQVADYG
jgi:hypothetical protein